MAEQPMVGCRVPHEWKAKLEAIAANTGRKPAQVVYEAIAQYLAETDTNTLTSQLRELWERLEAIEKRSRQTDAVMLQLTSLSARLTALEQATARTVLPTSLATGSYHTNAANSTEQQAVVEAIADLEDDIEDEPDEILYDFLSGQ